jgi:hypothetical protein
MVRAKGEGDGTTALGRTGRTLATAALGWWPLGRWALIIGILLALGARDVPISTSIDPTAIAVIPHETPHVPLGPVRHNAPWFVRLTFPRGDDNERPERSSLQFYIDGAELLRSPPLDVNLFAQSPAGVFSHWNDNLVFKRPADAAPIKAMTVSWPLVHPGLRIPLLLTLLMLALSFSAVRNTAIRAGSLLIATLERHVSKVVAAQTLVYAVAFNSLQPASMYLSPDSITYLSVNPIVPPALPIVVRELAKLDMVLADDRLLLYRFLMIGLYSLGGWLIARALWRAPHRLVSLLVLPAIWSANLLTMHLNYVLTEGMAASLLLVSIGAYAHAHLAQSMGDQRAAERWLLGFVAAGMLAFMSRPAFAFMLPCIMVLSLSRAILTRARVAKAGALALLILAAHYSLAVLWHGRLQGQSGLVLIALVFDLPNKDACRVEDSDYCRVERAVAPFADKVATIASGYDRYMYKAANNTYVTTAAVKAIKAKNRNEMLTEIALAKILSNPFDYVAMVVANSVHSIAANMGDYRFDMLGDPQMLKERVDANNDNAPRLRKETRLDMAPYLHETPVKRWYTDPLFQSLTWLFPHDPYQLFRRIALPLYVAAFLIGFLPLVVRLGVTGSIICFCALTVAAGVTFQNVAFPAIGRLIAPFLVPLVLATMLLLAQGAEGTRAAISRGWLRLAAYRLSWLNRPALLRRTRS